MKKTQLIEWGIITVGIVFGYKFFENIFSAIVFLTYQFRGGYSEVNSTLVTTLVLTAIYALSFVVLIRQSRPIASYLAGSPANENIPLRLGKQSVLHVVLIGICIASILSNLSTILIYLFETFKDEAGGRNPIYKYDTVTNFAFKAAAVQTIASLTILYFSRPISRWFVMKDEVDDLTFESEIKE